MMGTSRVRHGTIDMVEQIFHYKTFGIHTSVILTLASSTSDSSTDDNISLLGLEPKTVSLVGSGRAVKRNNVGALAVFPGADAQQESEGIRLLVAPQLFHILVSSHGD